MIKVQFKIGNFSSVSTYDYETFKKKIDDIKSDCDLTIEDMRIVGIIKGEKENDKN